MGPADHMSEEVQVALRELFGTISSWGRSTGRGYHVILIPHHQDEAIIMADNGNVLSPDTVITQESFFEAAMYLRNRDGRL